MAATVRKCPSCSGAITTADAARCDWCGTPLAGVPIAAPRPPVAQPVAPVDAARLDQALRQLEGLQRPVKRGVNGCLFFALLTVAVVFIFLLLFMSTGNPTPTSTPTSTPIDAPQPANASGPERPALNAVDTPVEGPANR